MARLIEHAKAQFRTELAKPNPKVEVPEWPDEEGNPSVFYVKKLTMADHVKITEASDRDGPLAGAIAGLMLRAVDTEGKRVFHAIDKDDLMTKVDPDIVFEVGARIAAARVVLTAEDVEQD